MTKITDRSLDSSQGIITSAGHGVSGLTALVNGDAAQFTSGHPSAGPVHDGPPAEGASSYKAEKAQVPVTVRMQGHSAVQTSGATVASLDKGAVRQAAQPGAPVTSRPDQPKFSGVQFKR